MIAHDGWRPTFKQSCWAALAMGLLLFIRDWSGYDKWNPDLFSPRPIREIWWHLPAAVAVSFGALQMARLFDWAKNRPWPYWIGYVIVLILVIFLSVWVLIRLA